MRALDGAAGPPRQPFAGTRCCIIAVTVRCVGLAGSFLPEKSPFARPSVLGDEFCDANCNKTQSNTRDDPPIKLS